MKINIRQKIYVSKIIIYRMGSQQSQIFQKDFKSQFFPNLYSNNLSTVPSLRSFNASLEQSSSNNCYTRYKKTPANENNQKNSLKIDSYKNNNLTNNQKQQDIQQYFNQMRTSSIDLYSLQFMLQLYNKNLINKQNYVLPNVQSIIFKKNGNKISQKHNERFSYEGDSMQVDQQDFVDLKSLHILKCKKEAKKIYVSSLFNKMAARGKNSQGQQESCLHEMARVQISPSKKQKTVNNSCIQCQKLVSKFPCILFQSLIQQQLQFNNYNDSLIKEHNNKI